MEYDKKSSTACARIQHITDGERRGMRLVVVMLVVASTRASTAKKCSHSSRHVRALDALVTDGEIDPAAALRLLHILNLTCYYPEPRHGFSDLIESAVQNCTRALGVQGRARPPKPVFSRRWVKFADVCDDQTRVGGATNNAAFQGDERLKRDVQQHSSTARHAQTGNVLDGGKLVCKAADALRPPCRVFSVGSNGDASFENGIHALSPECRIDTFDGTLVGRRSKLAAALPSFVRFHPLNWSPSTLGEIVQTLDGNAREGRKGAAWTPSPPPTLPVLKIDCDGCEFNSLMPFLERVCTEQILIEIHAVEPRARAFKR
jgi:hypothetical protein